MMVRRKVVGVSGELIAQGCSDRTLRALLVGMLREGER